MLMLCVCGRNRDISSRTASHTQAVALPRPGSTAGSSSELSLVPLARNCAQPLPEYGGGKSLIGRTPRPARGIPRPIGPLAYYTIIAIARPLVRRQGICRLAPPRAAPPPRACTSVAGEGPEGSAAPTAGHALGLERAEGLRVQPLGVLRSSCLPSAGTAPPAGARSQARQDGGSAGSLGWGGHPAPRRPGVQSQPAVGGGERVRLPASDARRCAQQQAAHRAASG